MVEGEENELARVEYTRGKNVRTTIDIELQSRIQSVFAAVPLSNPDKTIDRVPMHGAAVVIRANRSPDSVLKMVPSVT